MRGAPEVPAPGQPLDLLRGCYRTYSYLPSVGQWVKVRWYAVADVLGAWTPTLYPSSNWDDWQDEWPGYGESGVLPRPYVNCNPPPWPIWWAAALDLVAAGARTDHPRLRGIATLDLTAAGTRREAMARAGLATLDLIAAGTRLEELHRDGLAVLDLTAAGTSTEASNRAGLAVLDLTAAGTSTEASNRAGVATLKLSAAGTSTEASNRAGVATLKLSAAGTRRMAMARAGLATLKLSAAGTRRMAMARAGLATLKLNDRTPVWASLVQVKGTQRGGLSSANLTLTPSANVTSGNLLVVAVSYVRTSGGVPSVSDSQGNTWTKQVERITSPVTNRICQLWSATAGSTGSDTVTVALGGGFGFLSAAVAEFLPPASPVADGTNSASVTSTAPTASTVSVTNRGDLVLGNITVDTAATPPTIAASPPYTSLFSGGSGGTPQKTGIDFIVLGDQNELAASMFTPTWSLSNTNAGQTPAVALAFHF